MIRFRQKEFFWPAVLTIGATGASMVQASSQAKQTEEQAEETQELMRAQNKKLEKIAKAAKTNPDAAGQAAQVLKQGQYSVALSMGTMRNLVKSKQALQAIGTAGKEAFGKGLARNAAGGVGMGVAAYGAGKLIQRDMKKEGMDVDEDGNLYQKSYAVPVLGTITKAAGEFAKKHPKTALAAGGLGTGVGFVGAPTLLGYKADKAQMKEQIAATQKQFAVLPMSVMRGLVKGRQAIQAGIQKAKPVIDSTSKTITEKKDALVEAAKKKEIVKNPGKTLLGWGSTMTSFGVMGRENVGKFATNLMNSKSEWAQKLGKGMLSKDATGKLNPGEGKYAGQFLANKKAMAGAIGAGALATKATWDAGEKITNKIGHKVDPDAYKYQDAKNQQI